ncbi:MAG: baseplate J/gp47 family protein [Chloroflexota bacterium]
MKTQIITLAPHDDLISVRDRMSWAKSPRILVVWPGHEQVPLGPLDLRILQQHATELGAQIGVVTGNGGIRRDAESFGIPVFRSTAEAQRKPWPGRRAGDWRRFRQNGGRAAALRAMKEESRPGGARWSSVPAVRIGLFVMAVLAVFSIASVFVPRATIVLRPIAMEQSATMAVELSRAGTSSVLAGSVPAHISTVDTGGSQTIPVQSRSEIPQERAAGTARFQNLTQSPVVIPAGVVVYAVTPASVRFNTLLQARLDGRLNAFVDVPIQALEAGGIGNVPANAIQGIEGGLGASTTVTNPDPTAGGLDAVETVPSQEDRDHLRARLLDELETKAEANLAALVTEDDVILPGTMTLASIDEETFDPSPGQPGSVLSLAMRVTYGVTYVSGADLRRLADARLDASMPPEYSPRTDTVDVTLISAPTAGENGASPLNLEIRRTIMRDIDVNAVNQLVRGAPQKEALGRLESVLPLSAPPEVRLTPPWWPRLPLIPFRIAVIIQ